MDRPAPGQGTTGESQPSTRSPVEGVGAVGAATQFAVTTALAIATCALAPAYTVRWHLGPLPTTVLENAVLLTLAAFLFESIRGGIRPTWRARVTAPAALFVIAGAISVAVAPDHRAALGIYRAYFIEPIAFGLVLINTVTTPRRAIAIVGGLAA